MKPEDNNYLHSDLSEKIIGQVYKVYNSLGYGFLEKVYQRALKKKLIDIGLRVDEEYPIKVMFEDVVVGDFCADLFVEEKIILELKAIESLAQVHEVQDRKSVV
jgi:GxxExxY protein